MTLIENLDYPESILQDNIVWFNAYIVLEQYTSTTGQIIVYDKNYQVPLI